MNANANTSVNTNANTNIKRPLKKQSDPNKSRKFKKNRQKI